MAKTTPSKKHSPSRSSKQRDLTDQQRAWQEYRDQKLTELTAEYPNKKYAWKVKQAGKMWKEDPSNPKVAAGEY